MMRVISAAAVPQARSRQIIDVKVFISPTP
jgi:hypothetical protein